MNRSVVAATLSLLGISSAMGQGKILPDPARSCGNTAFKPHELCFETPQDGIARAEFLSEKFYAIILRTAKRCSISEEDRGEVQRLFPRLKVFSTRFGCDDDFEENISYTNTNEDYAFIAVYAGRTLKEAKARLLEVTATGRFPGANIRKMQVRLVSS
ncbi:MAG: hypothetical protein ABI821_17235 [Pseudomonadota bacterium]